MVSWPLSSDLRAGSLLCCELARYKNRVAGDFLKTGSEEPLTPPEGPWPAGSAKAQVWCSERDSDFSAKPALLARFQDNGTARKSLSKGTRQPTSSMCMAGTPRRGSQYAEHARDLGDQRLSSPAFHLDRPVSASCWKGKPAGVQGSRRQVMLGTGCPRSPCLTEALSPAGNMGRRVSAADRHVPTAAVEACILHGLRRRAAGFLRSNKIAALFMKVGKSFPLAEELSRKVQDLEQLIESTRNQIQGLQENARKLPKLPNLSPLAIKHLWIRTALFEKVLDKIVHYLVENSSKYYEKEALLVDPVDGPILASLLVGPCALEYTKMKTADHFWTDPSADELVQRHRIHSSHLRQDSPSKRPALCIQKRHSSGSMDDRPSLSARDYVESLHQNSRATLLYGKNNVLVQPRDDMEAVPGYLSLHQTADIMTLKWTPNQLMNGSMGDLDYEKSVYWDYAMTIRLEEIVYLHCHQQVDSGGTVVLVSQDGIQRPPFRFPKGGHLLQFLSCLENGLLPHGQLDPPLWSQRGKGKVFPKLRKRSPQGSSESTSSDKEDEEATDYVFRIIYPGSQSEFAAPDLLASACPISVGPAWMMIAAGQSTLVVARGSRWARTRWNTALPTPGLKEQPPFPQDLMDVSVNNLPSLWQPSPRKSSCSSCSQSGSAGGSSTNGCNHERAPLKLLCDNMKYQILSRAFYGWLAYCRHLSTVRTHLSALVNHMIVSPDLPCDAGQGLTARIWEQYLQDSTSYEEQELLRLIYYGGIQPEIRKAVWPFLLGHYQFGMTETDRKEVGYPM
ncbi:hypothetical protein GHT09_006360 [Marmota monax]|uniref:RUN domain-containing protein n=1 Tax=Marmota monax TaxID=9995 RepID=A0A834PYL9_MARMO|nr:hypothetical protein GHT09_006360 [Marmota monax]